MPVGTADLYRGISELACERGNLETAVRHLLTAQKIGEHAVLTGWSHRLCLAEARLKQAQGDLAGALDRLDERSACISGVHFPTCAPSLHGGRGFGWHRAG
jgi:LuxR family maltose regulon positive regulatory protein